jgi:membrane associated rhomboid family serine protease
LIPLRDINPTKNFPIVTLSLIVLNVLVFLYELSLGAVAGERFLLSFALVPRWLFYPDSAPLGGIPAAATMVTSMFLHGGFLHMGGNMLYLWIFGNNVEDAMGRFRYITFYLLSGLCAAFAHAFMNRASMIPMIGASGAVSGVLGAYLLLFPKARVMTLIMFGFYVRTVAVPAMAVLGLWFVLQILNAMIAGGGAGGVAWYAHLAGFVAGMLLIGPFKRRNVPFGGGRSFQDL